MRTYVIETNEEQAEIIKNALELYARIRIGQWNEVTDLCLDLRNEEYMKKKDAINSGMKELRKIAFPELPINTRLAKRGRSMKSCAIGLPRRKTPKAIGR